MPCFKIWYTCFCMRYYIVSILLIAGLTFGGLVFAQPDQADSNNVGGNKDEIEALNERIAEKRAAVQELEESIEAYKQEISAYRLESVSLSNQIAILDNRNAQIELDIQATEAKLDALTLEIEALVLSIEDKNVSIDRQKDLIGELVRTIHQDQSKSMIEIFAAYDSFSDFYNRLQYLRTVESDLGRSARGLRISKEELEEKVAQAEEIKLSFETVREELENKRSDLEEQTNYKASLLAQTQSSELKYQTLLDSLRAQYRSIEREIQGIEQEVRDRLEAEERLNRINDSGGTVLSWPTQSRYITCAFHCVGYPFAHVFQHSGMDIRAAQGTPLKAAASGYVARAKRCSSASCYSFVMLIHANGISTVYGHMSAIYVTEDQFVTRGDVIGLSGGTPGTVGAGPFVTGPHLHFEVRQDGIPVNPAPFML